MVGGYFDPRFGLKRTLSGQKTSQILKYEFLTLLKTGRRISCITGVCEIGFTRKCIFPIWGELEFWNTNIINHFKKNVCAAACLYVTVHTCVCRVRACVHTTYIYINLLYINHRSIQKNIP